MQTSVVWFEELAPRKYMCNHPCQVRGEEISLSSVLFWQCLVAWGYLSFPPRDGTCALAVEARSPAPLTTGLPGDSCIFSDFLKRISAYRCRLMAEHSDCAGKSRAGWIRALPEQLPSKGAACLRAPHQATAARLLVYSGLFYALIYIC